MTHPQITVTVDGKPVAGAFFESLVSLTVNDLEGIQSDSIDLVFNDPAPHFDQPRRGALVEVRLRSEEHVFLGAYIINRVTMKCLPYTIAVRGHSADLRSEMKSSKTKHWDNKTVKQIVAEKASDHGLEARISDRVSGHRYEWIGQQDESDLHFLERLAKRHGALFTIKNGTLLWLERGKGLTADGNSVPPAIIPATSIVLGTCQVSETDVDRYAKVKAYWQDRLGAKRQEVVVDADPEASGEHVLRDPFSSKAEAERAAKAAAQEIIRGLIETGCSVVGRPDLMAGQPISYLGVRTHVDGRAFILSKVTHSFSKTGGLKTVFAGKLKIEE